MNSNQTMAEAQDIVETIYAMGPGLTMNDRYRFMAECLARASLDGRRAERERCARVADEVRHAADRDDSETAGVWRLACSEISQKIRHGD